MNNINNRFYNPQKKYFRRTPVLSVYEKKFFKLMRDKLKNNFIITPQVNLQTIIETDSKERNDELFRNIDFGIFDTEMYNPILMIEINGPNHYNTSYWKRRDASINEILNQANIMLYTINNEDLNKDIEILTDEIVELIYKIENLIYY